jgi:hypothetical protein
MQKIGKEFESESFSFERGQFSNVLCESAVKDSAPIYFVAALYASFQLSKQIKVYEIQKNF